MLYSGAPDNLTTNRFRETHATTSWLRDKVIRIAEKRSAAQLAEREPDGWVLSPG